MEQLNIDTDFLVTESEDNQLFQFCVDSDNKATELSVKYPEIKDDLARYIRALITIWFPDDPKSVKQENIMTMVKMFNALAEERKCYDALSNPIGKDLAIVRLLYSKLTPDDVKFIREIYQKRSA